MKKLVFITLIITMNYCFGQITSGEITYKKRIDFSDSRYKNLVLKNVVSDIKQNIGDLKYTLKFKDQKAIFFLQKNLTSDFSKMDRVTKRILFSAHGKNSFYTDLDNNTIKELIEVGGETFLVENKKPTIKLSNESKTINSYKCYKASWIEVEEFSKLGMKGMKDATHNIEVWYTPEIPVKFGPIKSFGLPGLILELKYNNVAYYATKISLNSNTVTTIEKPKGKDISKEKYTQMMVNKLQEMMNN